LPWFDGRVRRRFFTRRFALLGATLALVVVTFAVAIKGLDVQVLTEAGKSFTFRLEYWRATMAMIARHPWLGVGPGNFQDYYTQFKLPQASEEIRDPHNFLLEVWATAGSFALLALCEVLVVFAWRTWNLQDHHAVATRASTAVPTRRSTEAARPSDAAPSALRMTAGGAIGFLLALVIGPSVGLVLSEYQLAGGLALAGVTMAIAWPWVMDGRLAPRMLALGVLVLLVHLLASGGIAFPGVAGSLWILLALGLNASEVEPAAEPGQGRRFGSRLASVVALVLVSAASAACYFLAYMPVVRLHAALARADDEQLGVDARINRLVDAAAADPLSSEPWSRIAELELARLQTNPTHPASNERFMKATAKVIELRPHSSIAWRQVGRWFHECYAYNHRPDTVKAAAVSLRRAVELYPNLAALRGEYALALAAQGERAAARRQLQTARRLDAATAHADKKLSPELRRQLDRLDAALR
jgi:hypothetical protein